MTGGITVMTCRRKEGNNNTQTIFYVVRTVHLEMKLYNDQRNAHVFNIFIYLLMPYMFRAFFKPIFRGRRTLLAVVLISWALKPYPGDLNHYQICTSPSEYGLKEIPKHVRQK
jgi:hypothetical protein